MQKQKNIKKQNKNKTTTYKSPLSTTDVKYIVQVDLELLPLNNVSIYLLSLAISVVVAY